MASAVETATLSIKDRKGGSTVERDKSTHSNGLDDTPDGSPGSQNGHDEKQRQETTRPNIANPSQFPDGGFSAWFCVAGGFCSTFCTFGWANAIGVFQEYYETTLLTSYSPSAISWIVSLETFFMFFGAPFIGKIFDSFGPRWLLISGAFMSVFGLMMQSLSTEYYQLILSQGICYPIGASCCLYPAMSSTVTWFQKKRALALGIMVSGSSLGGVIFPIMLQRLIPQLGYGWAIRVSAFIMLALLSVACVGIRSRIPPSPKPWSIMDFIKPFSEPAFATLCAANFFGFLGLFIPFNYITLSALNLGMSTALSSYLLSILNAGSIVGRIFPSWAADKLGKYNTQIVMCTLSVIVNLGIWLPARGNATLIVFAALYGIVSGTFVSLAPALVAQVTSDMRQMGTRTGIMFMTVSFGVLVGNPIAGALVTAGTGKYVYLQIFTGLVIAVAVALLVLSKSLSEGQLFKKF